MILPTLLLLLAGCSLIDRVEPVDPPLSAPLVDTMIIWKKPLTPDTVRHSSAGVLLSPNCLVVPVHIQNPLDPPQHLFAYNPISGDSLWHWSDWWNSTNEEVGILFPTDVRGELLAFNSYSRAYGINLKTGKSTWTRQETDTDYHRATLGDYAYVAADHDAYAGQQTYAQVWRISLQNGGKWEKIWNWVGDSTFWRSGICGITPFIAANGDEMLFFQLRRLDKVEHVDVICYNATQMRQEWFLKDIDPHGSANIQPALHENGRLFWQGVQTLFCFDAATGAEIWRRPSNGVDGFSVSSIASIDEECFVVGTNAADLVAFRKADGSEKWRVARIHGMGGTNFHVRNGHVIFGAGYLYGLNVKTGAIDWKFASPHNSGFGGAAGEIAMDPVTGDIFATDTYFLMRIKAPF